LQFLHASGQSSMQIPRAGDLVYVRRIRWRVAHVRDHESCQVVTLRGVAPPRAGLERRVLTPFDAIERVARGNGMPRFVRAVVWRRTCRALLSADTPPGSLTVARSAHIDLLPHQLEPALAIVRGLSTRVLLADDVGLGKTIQAGLVTAELLARGAIERVLVLTPAGLRDQWTGELSSRFGVQAVSVDGPLLRRTATMLPVGVNPWLTLPFAVASVDYVKRAEVLPAVSACAWELVVVDEAHGVSGDSDRRAAVHALASRAAYVLLLSATPHSGDRTAFASLCDLGAVDATPLTVFRRARSDVGVGTARRIHLVRIHLTPNERRAHVLLSRYGDALRADRGPDVRGDALLALSVLHKRALSSAWSLARSVERRLEALTSTAAEDGQIALPFGDVSGDLVRADEPPPWPDELRLSDAGRERRLLAALLEAARAASASETKVRRLDALLRRTREQAVVFTEYRDTLMHLQRGLTRPALVLHGGLSRGERAAVLAEFGATPAALLLATDAAAEGLNLQARCRLVVNLELPWNPMRLEQRIGRVDRIGQTRTVHAFHLVAAGTREMRILERLRARITDAGADIGVVSPLDDEEIARRVLTGDVSDEHHDG
jgi:SNF2 family DNA or RNA helicase